MCYTFDFRAAVQLITLFMHGTISLSMSGFFGYVNFKETIIRETEFLDNYDIVAGTPEERAAIEHLKKRFEELGLEARVLEFEALSWRENYVELSAGDLRLRAVAMPYTLSGEVEGKVVYTGSRILEEDWASIDLTGKIVLIKIYDKVDEVEWQYLQAVRAGADAVIFMDRYPSRVRRMVLTLNTDYRFSAGTPPPIPAVAVTLEDGLRILKLAREHRKLFLKVETRIDPSGRSAVIYAGNLRGPVFSAHVDKWLTGFRDNVLGVGFVLHAANLFRERAGYIIFGSEESGAPSFSPWYWTWGSRVFAEFLEKNGLLEEFGVLLNVDTLGGSSLRISASSPDIQAWLTDSMGSVATVCSDQVLFDSLSFTLKGLPAMTFHTFPEIIPVYHTDLDVADTVDWESTERAFKLLEHVASELIKRGVKAFKYEELIRSISESLEKVSFLPSARKALNLVKGLKVESESEARTIRRLLTRPMFWGRYDRVFKDSVVFYPTYTDAIDDLLLLHDILSGVRSPEEVTNMRGLRRIPGYEETLASVEPVFYGRPLTKPEFLRHTYMVLEKIVEEDVERLVGMIENLKR
ncbi:MAG: M28 family peptidase [Infirmifilum sp.]|uniref:M28 family peptidase n=1 Tax=Infirmifilum sp. TaxID=2856575 RepID=UPI003D0FC12B